MNDHQHHQDHAAHGHDGHGHHAGHAAHGTVAHVAPADWRAAYSAAYEAAQPEPGCRVVPVDLEAREVDWEFSPGRRTRAWGFNGQVPGPTIEAEAGDDDEELRAVVAETVVHEVAHHFGISDERLEALGWD